MRIHNCLIFTSSTSRIEMRPDEMGDFAGNLVVNDSVLKNCSMAPEAWEDVLKRLNNDSAPTDHGRAAMHKEVVG